MRTLGEPKETIEIKVNKKKLKNCMDHRLWFSIWRERESIKSADAKLKKFNRTKQNRQSERKQKKIYCSKSMQKCH